MITRFLSRSLSPLSLLILAACADTQLPLAMLDSSVADCDEDSDEACSPTHVEPGDGDDAHEPSDEPRGDAAIAGDGDGDGDEEPAGDGDGDGDAPIDEDAPDPDAGSDAGDEPEPITCLPGHVLDDDGVTCVVGCHECLHGECNETLPIAACDCFPGYRDDGEGCVWIGDGDTGGVLDRELNDESAWQRTHVTIADGVATFDNAGSGADCELGALAQTLQMPERTDAEPFVLDIEAQTRCTSSDPEECPPLLVSIGRNLTRVTAPGDANADVEPAAQTFSACMTETGYGSDVALRIRPGLAFRHGEAALSCDTTEWPAITRVAVRPAHAGECSDDDALAGDLESDEGWALEDARIQDDTLVLDEGGVATTRFASTYGSGRAIGLHLVGGASHVNVRIDGLLWKRVEAGTDPLLCVPQWAQRGSHVLAFESIGGPAAISELGFRSDWHCQTGAFDTQIDRRQLTDWSTDNATLSLNTGRIGAAFSITEASSLTATMRLPAPPEGDPTFLPSLLFWTRRSSPPMNLTATYQIPLLDAAPIALTEMDWQQHQRCFARAWADQLATVRLDFTAVTMGQSLPAVVSFDDAGPASTPPNMCD